MSNTPTDNLQLDQRRLIEQANQLEYEFNSFVSKLKRMTGPDGRNLSLAITHGEDSFMRLRRSIALGQQDPGFYRNKPQGEIE